MWSGRHMKCFYDDTQTALSSTGELASLSLARSPWLPYPLAPGLPPLPQYLHIAHPTMLLRLFRSVFELALILHSKPCPHPLHMAND